MNTVPSYYGQDQQGGGGLLSLIQGLMGGSGSPYEKYADTYKNYLGQATGAQNPFYKAGTQATGDYQDWAQKMKDPSGFVNNLMSGYSQSPWAKNQQNAATRAATNFGSANGLTGSTPLMQQAQQTAGQISSQDQNQWLQHVLGINTEYGGAEHNLMQGGEHSADIMSQLFNQGGENLGQASAGQRAGQQQDRNSMISGILQMLLHGAFS